MQLLQWEDGPCLCRRCLIHNDPGGCLVSEAIYCLCTWLAGTLAPVGPGFDYFGNPLPQVLA